MADKKHTHTKNTKKILEWRRSKFVNDEAEAARVVPLLQADRKRIFSQDHFNGVPKNAQTQRSKSRMSFERVIFTSGSMSSKTAF